MSIIGIGEDGLSGLPPASRAALDAAQAVFGAPRHLALAGIAADRAQAWPVPFDIGPLLARRGQPTAMLASGDPFWHGAGGTVAARLTPGEWRAFPVAGIVSLVAARMGWRIEDVRSIGLHAAPFTQLRPVLTRGARVICTLRDAAAVAELADWLAAQGLGATRMTVAEAVGGPRERLRQWPVPADSIAAPVAVALDSADLPRDAGLPGSPGLPDAAFLHDGQITRAPVRALTLAALSPRPGQLLWDIGAGSGSVSVEWCLAGGHAVAIEPRTDRAATIRQNAEAFGVGDRLRVVQGSAPDVFSGLPAPDAIFVGGGGLDGAESRLSLGARLVANAVTLESESRLAQLHAAHGGRLLRIELAEAAPLGRMRGWQPARPIVQWSWP